MSRLLTTLLLLAAALGLTVIFWLPLWRGGGFVGGDVYSYYLPQKVYYAESLAAGEFPLWNNRAGFGYPLVAESQTGPFYPFHLLFYRFLEVNTAYNANHLLHYVLAFLFAWLYARRIGLGRAGAGGAALVYVYGWFPPRACWEWAIIGGTWLPAAFWCAESFLQTRLWRWAVGLSAVLAVQLLAGHYNIAFITLVTLTAYVPLRLWFAHRDLPQPAKAVRGRVLLLVAAAIGLGIALAAVQILPTWELKGESQRAAAGQHHPLAHGSSPANYWSQIFLPWQWYSVDVYRDYILEQMSRPLGAKTNQVEAHLYFGLVPLGLALLGVLRAITSRDRTMILWLCLGVAAMVYGWAWLVPIMQYVPGFNFFQGPGRWGIVTTVAVGLLAGRGLETALAGRNAAATIFAALLIPAALFSSHLLAAGVSSAAGAGRSPLEFAGIALSGELTMVFWYTGLGAAVATGLLAVASSGESQSLKQRAPWAMLGKVVLGTVLAAATIIDLWIVSRLVTYSTMVPDPPIAHLEESPVRRILSEYDGVPRMLAPGANLSTVLGASALPVYLTFGPREYVDPELAIPEGWPWRHPPEAAERVKKIARIHQVGTTHVLSFSAFPDLDAPGQLVWSGFDPLLNPAWARFRTPIYLYELEDAEGRVRWADADPDATAKVTEYRANRVTIEDESASGGTLVLTDLMSRGWTVSVDGHPAEPLRIEGLFRGVKVPAGTHRVVWTYRKRSLYWGAGVSVAAFLLLAVIAHVRYWHPQRLRFFNEEAPT